MARPKFPVGTGKLSNNAIIARHLFPSAYDYEEWSTDVAERLQDARCAAQDLMRAHPERARKILAEHKARELEKMAAALRVGEEAEKE